MVRTLLLWLLTGVHPSYRRVSPNQYAYMLDHLGWEIRHANRLANWRRRRSPGLRRARAFRDAYRGDRP